MAPERTKEKTWNSNESSAPRVKSQVSNKTASQDEKRAAFLFQKRKKRPKPGKKDFEGRVPGAETAADLRC